jgi:hypothetical protein
MAGTPKVWTHTISGADGTTLYVQDAGDSSDRPLLFIHSFCHCRLAWVKQFRVGSGQ